jgi:SHS2 domain-containing protein
VRIEVLLWIGRANPVAGGGVFFCQGTSRRGSINGMHETFDHTADLGLRVRAADLSTLFAEAGLALEGALVEDLTTVTPARSLDVRLGADDLDYLLFDWLKLLLYRFEEEQMLFCRFELTVDDTGLKGVAHGEPFDPARHQLSHEVKAITYHGLKVERTADGWLAEVIVDI